MLHEVKQTLITLLWPLPPGGVDRSGWPLGRSVRTREVEVDVSRVAGVREVTGLKLFRRENDAWVAVPGADDANATLDLSAWQLPELLAVVVSDDPAGVPDELAGRLLDRFSEVGLIDDAAYARQWVESRHRSRELAPRALAQELRRKGVDDDDAKAALEQIDEADQRVAARALVDKKLRSMRGLDHQVATRRLAGLLARKGYGAALAYSVVREALGEAEDDEPHPDF